MAQHFFFKLLPPRPDFAMTITPEELAQMHQHRAYLQPFFDNGKLLLFGPVLDPEGSFGLGILEMEDLEEAQAFAKGDPTVVSGMNSYSIAPMRVGGAQASSDAG